MQRKPKSQQGGAVSGVGEGGAGFGTELPALREPAAAFDGALPALHEPTVRPRGTMVGHDARLRGEGQPSKARRQALKRSRRAAGLADGA